MSDINLNQCPNILKNTDFLIWRRYFNSNIPILGGTHDVHKKIINNIKKSSSLSKYNNTHAALLTKFFKEYKQLSNTATNQLKDFMLVDIMGANNISLPFIDFGISGTKFEHELYKLIDLTWNQLTDSSLGSQSASVYINIGQGPLSEEFVKKTLGESYSELVENFTKAVENKIIQSDANGNVYIKVKTSRSGKIDVQGSGIQNVNIQGIANEDLSNIINLLGNATFSVKSYKSKSSIHFGHTVGAKAIAAMAEYTGTKRARGSALFYISHPKITNSLYSGSDEKEELEHIYEHYNHMKKIYELSGLGLTYNDLTELTHVDFLVVNRTQGDIAVYSVKELINQFLNTGKFNLI